MWDTLTNVDNFCLSWITGMLSNGKNKGMNRQEVLPQGPSQHCHHNQSCSHQSHKRLNLFQWMCHFKMKWNMYEIYNLLIHNILYNFPVNLRKWNMFHFPQCQQGAPTCSLSRTWIHGQHTPPGQFWSSSQTDPEIMRKKQKLKKKIKEEKKLSHQYAHSLKTISYRESSHK